MIAPKETDAKARRQKAEQAGRRAEWLVSLYLRLTGHTVLAQRFKTPSGEIDLIARRGRTLIFLEVKQRAKADHAIDLVSAQSERRIIRAGEIYLSRHPHFIEQDFALRYDIVTVIGRWRLRHERDMFRGW